MPRNKVTKTGREDGEVAGYVRFALNKEELALLDEACKLEEHCRSDIARIYTMRLCRYMVGFFQQNKFMNEAQVIMQSILQEIDDKKKSGNDAGKKK